MQRVNIANRRFGRLVAQVFCPAGTVHVRASWKCVCDCGNVYYTQATALLSGRTQSCGCYRSESVRANNLKRYLSGGCRIEIEDLVGRCFGGLLVERRSDFVGRGMWWCRCICGEECKRPITTYELKTGVRKSCGCAKKSDCDVTRFKKCDTEEEAYWLGMMYTDGWMLPGKRIVGLTLSQRDEEHVKAFKAFLNTDKKLSYVQRHQGNAVVMYRVQSPEIFDNLIIQGCTPRKTWSITPWNGPKSLLRHFWRGCIDGDGCIYLGKQIQLSYCGNESMVVGLSEYIRTELNLTGSVRFREPTGKKAREAGYRFANVSYGKYPSVVICDHLYRNSHIALERKRNKAEFLADSDMLAIALASLTARGVGPG